ncbi:MAG: DUF4338 domain-containing protein [Verrucomicrobia bacterium]|nr:DUF4338 domain-containing protein [Verrucomicrobiota bacterium]
MTNSAAGGKPSPELALEEVQLRLVEPGELKRFDELLEAHHYLGAVKPVGQRLHYVVTDHRGRWLALLVFGAAARHLKHRDRWIGWSNEQRRRRLSLVTNNLRFLLLPEASVPNLGTKALSLVRHRIAADWEQRYGHPVEVLESFVDPEQFCGTVYTAAGWIEVGQTEGWGRTRRDYYVKHDRPKRLFVCALERHSTRRLQAEVLVPRLAAVEAAVPPRSQLKVREIRSLIERLKAVPDLRTRIESYPLWSLLGIQLMAHLAGAPRGQKDLAIFARGLSEAQRRALGVRANRQGNHPAPSQSTFCRMQQQVGVDRVAQVLKDIQRQLRGEPPPEELIVLDGKEPKHGNGDAILTAVSVPGQFLLGCARVPKDKTNEIPVARALFGELDLEGRRVSLDALHTCRETARDLVQHCGADYLLTVKDNHPELQAPIRQLVPAPEAGFPPRTPDSHPAPDRGAQQGPA